MLHIWKCTIYTKCYIYENVLYIQNVDIYENVLYIQNFTYMRMYYIQKCYWWTIGYNYGINAEDKPQCSLSHQNKIIQDLRNRSTDGGDFSYIFSD